MYFSFLPAAFFGAPPPMKDIVRRKALQSAPRSGRIFASEGALGDLWAVCRVVKSTARACPYGRLGQTTKPARGRTRHACQSAQQSSGYTPRKSNGTTRAGRCTDASPARQARINSPEQSLKHRCQAVPGRLNRPAVLEQCPRHVGWAALSFDPAGRTVTRSHCCLRLTRGQPCLGGSAAIACSTRRGSVGAVPLSQHRCC